MNVTKIIETMLLIGADLPAYKALLDQILALFAEDDQAKLKAAYVQAKAQSDAAHAAAQAL